MFLSNIQNLILINPLINFKTNHTMYTNTYLKRIIICCNIIQFALHTFFYESTKQNQSNETSIRLKLYIICLLPLNYYSSHIKFHLKNSIKQKIFINNTSRQLVNHPRGPFSVMLASGNVRTPGRVEATMRTNIRARRARVTCEEVARRLCSCARARQNTRPGRWKRPSDSLEFTLRGGSPRSAV